MTDKRKVPEIRFKWFDGEWEKLMLKDIVSDISDGDWINANHIYEAGEYRIIQTGNLGLGYYLDKKGNAKYFHQKDFIELNANEIFPGDILISRLAAPAGRAIILPDTGYRMVTAVDVAIIRPNRNTFNSEFIVTLLNRTETLNKVSEDVSGTTHQRISRKNLEKLVLATPEVSEQSQIGTFFQNLDSLITQHQRKYNKLTTVKKAMLEKMFPKDGDDVPEIRFKGFTEKWERRALGEVIEISSAARVHKNEWTQAGVPFFRSSDVVAAYNGKTNSKAFISVELYQELTKLIGRVQRNDILVTGGGSIGIPYLVESDDPLYFKDADLLWFKKSENISGRFLYTFLTTKVFRCYIQSITHIGTISHYTIEQAKSTPIKLPSLDEQNEIEEFFNHLDSLITLQQRELDKLKNIKKACLEKMFV